MGPGPGVIAPAVAAEIRVEYPASTRRLGITGEVVVLVEVDERGRVIEGRVLRGTRIESVDQAVLAAVRATPFIPPTKDGVPVKMWTTVRFALRP